MPSRKLEVVVTPEPKKKKDRWAVAMSVFAKFEPGLGHDGVGLYGTLTDASVRVVLERAKVRGRTHFDVGAGDGKVMLGALAAGAARSFGVEIAGDALETKFRAMKAKLEAACDETFDGDLKCGVDITDFDAPVERWLVDCFNVVDADDIVVTAVWHGFNVEAKESLLAALAMSSSVTAFTLVGPVRKDYGTAAAVRAFFLRFGTHVSLVHDDRATLAGGESYRALTFHMQ